MAVSTRAQRVAQGVLHTVRTLVRQWLDGDDSINCTVIEEQLTAQLADELADHEAQILREIGNNDPD